MTDFDSLDQNRRVIEDFALRTLHSISGDVARLLYVASLRDLATGRYRHEGLTAIHSESAVDQSLRLCHEELFERLLESSLEQQEADLRGCLAGFDVPLAEVAARWREHEFYRFLIPSGAPVYLRELFCSNFTTLLRLLVEERLTQPSAS